MGSVKHRPAGARADAFSDSCAAYDRFRTVRACLKRSGGEAAHHQADHRKVDLLSGKGLAVSNSGIRWVIFALVVPVPWTRRRWALPFLSIAATPPEVRAAVSHRHHTVGDIAQLGCRLLHHWVPDRAWTLVGDGGYSIIDLGLAAQDQQGALPAPLRFDANLFEPAPPRPAAPNRTDGHAVKGPPSPSWKPC